MQFANGLHYRSPFAAFRVTHMFASCGRAVRASFALALCLFVLTATSLAAHDAQQRLDDSRQAVAQTLQANTGASGRPWSDGDHEETALAGAGRFLHPDPRPVLTTLVDDVLSERSPAVAFNARAPPSPLPPVIG